MFGFFKKSNNNDFTFSVSSNVPIEQIVESVPAKIWSYGFALLQTYDYHEIVASKGFPIEGKVFVYEICKAKIASSILEVKPDFAPFMPCRIAIYEKDSGLCTISIPNMVPMLSTLPRDGGLYDEANELYQELKVLVRELAV